MPSAEESVRQRLGSDPAVAALIADRIYPGVVPAHDAPTPWVYYTVPSSVPVEKLGVGGVQDTVHTFELSVFADTYADGQAVEAAVRSCLNGWRGGQVKRALWTGTSSQAVDDGFGFELTFTVRSTDGPVVPTQAGLPRLELREDGVYYGGRRLAFADELTHGSFWPYGFWPVRLWPVELWP